MDSLESYKKLVFELQKSGIKSAEIDTQILLEFVTKKSREFLLSHPEYELSAKEYESILKLVDRRKSIYPMAYITGQKEFFGIDFEVTPDVLIPRPETELLVENALDFLKARSCKPTAVLDIGTGSGNIIISIAKANSLKLTANSYFASDISVNALKVAKKNAKKHSVEKQIEFIQSDLFENIKGKFDLIIANLPYVPIDGSDDKEIKFEPQSAIFSKDNGTEIIKKFLDQTQDHINKEGLILVEVDPRNAIELKNYAIKLYKSVELKKDFSGIYRVITILT